MSSSQLQAFRRLLELKEKELSGASSERSELTAVRSPDLVEQTQNHMRLGLAVSQLNSRWELLRAVREALDRLRNGDYGFCEACGGRIHVKRLEAVPWTRACTRCQSLFEAAEDARRVHTAA